MLTKRTTFYALAAMALLLAPAAARAELIVVTFDGVYRFDDVSGAAVGTQPITSGATISQGAGVRYGPDGNLYVSSQNTGEVQRYNHVTGAYIDDFVAPLSGGLLAPADLRFHGGYLYVADFFASDIKRYNAGTGVFVDALDFDGMLAQPTAIKFDAAGNLYVSSFTTNQVLKYDPTATPGSEYSVFASHVDLNGPIGLTFGPNDGHLYVVSTWNFMVQRFDGTTGAYLGSGPGLDEPFAETGPDSFPSDIVFNSDGKMLISSLTYGAVLQFDATTGAALGPFTTEPGLTQLSLMTLTPIDGDANSDEVVDIADVLIVGANWLTTGPTGDVNRDGTIDIADVLTIGANWLETGPGGAGDGGQGAGSTDGATPVPEPATFALAALGIAGCFARRRFRATSR